MNVQTDSSANGIRWGVAHRAWLITALITLGLFLASLPGYWAGFVFNAPVEASAEYVSVFYRLSTIISICSAVISLALAGVLFWRKPNDPMAFFISFYLLGYGFIMAGPLEALEIVLYRQGAISVMVQTILMTTPTLALFFLFPNGKFVPRWTRYLTWSSLLLIPIVAFFGTPEEWLTMKTPITWATYLVMGFILMVGIYAQIHRYRFISNPIEQKQTQWVVLGLLLWIALMIAQSAPYFYLSNMPTGAIQPWWAPLIGAMWWLSLSILPLVLAFAVLRYRLFDINLLIRRTLIYSVITVLLAVFYFGAVIFLQQLFRTITGAGDDLAIIVSTLSLAALFNPLRRHVQDSIDHRFYRRKYDAQKVLERFAATARDEVELEKLTGELLRIVDETMQPTHMSLWLKKTDDRGQKTDANFPPSSVIGRPSKGV